MSWKENFDERELKEIEFDKEYFLNYRHGTDGHNLRMVIAKLAIILDAPPSLDAPLDDEQLIRHIKAKADELGSYSALAEKLGVSPSYLSMVVSGGRDFNEALLDGLGFKRVYVYIGDMERKP